MANKLNLPSYESLLQSGEQARDNGAEKVVTIPVDQIRDPRISVLNQFVINFGVDMNNIIIR